MQIAPGISTSEWKLLHLNNPDNPDWFRAIEIFKTRIIGRYTDAADLLIDADEPKPPTERCFGFAVMAIDCLLIETLAAFRMGLTATRGQSKAVFSDFLATRPLFNKHFTKFYAEQFYDEFRCGILHQAEIKGTSRVWSVGKVIDEDAGRLTVNRTEFHKLVKREIESHAQELADTKNTDLREKFRSKMDFICRV